MARVCGDGVDGAAGRVLVCQAICPAALERRPGAGGLQPAGNDHLFLKSRRPERKKKMRPAGNRQARQDAAPRRKGASLPDGARPIGRCPGRKGRGKMPEDRLVELAAASSPSPGQGQRLFNSSAASSWRPALCRVRARR